MESRNKIFIASDFHLGLDLELSSKEREDKIVSWLDEIKLEAQTLILLGDTFDYWFEYKNCIPKDYNKLIGKLLELSESGVSIEMHTGNHDMWLFDYFEKTLGAKIVRNPVLVEYYGKRIFIGHGDGVGPGDYLYKIIKAVFRNRTCQWLFARIHPNTGLAIMKYFSKRSRDSQKPEKFKAESERQIQFAEKYLERNFADYFIFGHRHLPIKYTLSNGKSLLLNTGDWMWHFSFIEITFDSIELKFYQSQNENIYGS